jgi:hypothetical protein
VRPKGVADGQLVNIPVLLLVSMRGRWTAFCEAMVSVTGQSQRGIGKSAPSSAGKIR